MEITASSPRHFFSDWKPIEIMLALMFVVAPLYYHPNLGGDGFRIPDNITIWTVAVIIISYSLLKVINGKTFQLPRYFLYIAAFPNLATLSGFIAGVEQPLDWAFRLSFIWGGFAFFFALFQHRLSQEKIDRILFMIVFSALLEIIIGVFQIWFKLEMPFWLPVSPNGVPSALFQQINDQASYQVTAIMLAFYLSVRPLMIRSPMWLKSIIVISVAGGAYIIGVSGSRIGLLTLILSLPLISYAIKSKIKQNKSLIMVLYLAVITGFSGGLFSHNLTAIDKTIAMQSGYSGSMRLGIYSISLDLIEKKPLFGHGIGSFPRVWQYAKPEFFAKHPNGVLPNEFVSHPHNEIILWLVEGGITAFAGILAVLVGVVLALRRQGKQQGVAITALLLPITLHTQVELPFYMSALHWFVFLFLLYVLFSPLVSTKINRMSVIAQKTAGISVMVITIILMVFFAHTIRSNWDFVEFYEGKQLKNPLPYAYKNPYLGEEARWIDFSTILYSSIQHGITRNVEAYAKWGTDKLKERPDIDLYKKLLDAYNYLGNKGAFCKVANQGVRLYPSSDRLKNAHELCQY